RPHGHRRPNALFARPSLHPPLSCCNVLYSLHFYAHADHDPRRLSQVSRQTTSAVSRIVLGHMLRMWRQVCWAFHLPAAWASSNIRPLSPCQLPASCVLRFRHTSVV
ncbi:hypothetical protein OH76DRAFT_1413162, partial [Lentinus brumalis]